MNCIRGGIGWLVDKNTDCEFQIYSKALESIRIKNLWGRGSINEYNFRSSSR